VQTQENTMCGRSVQRTPLGEIRVLFETVNPIPNAAPNYNAAPTDTLPVVRLDRDRRRSLDLLRWGLIPWWAKDAKIARGVSMPWPRPSRASRRSATRSSAGSGVSCRSMGLRMAEAARRQATVCDRRRLGQAVGAGGVVGALEGAGQRTGRAELYHHDRAAERACSADPVLTATPASRSRRLIR